MTGTDVLLAGAMFLVCLAVLLVHRRLQAHIDAPLEEVHDPLYRRWGDHRTSGGGSLESLLEYLRNEDDVRWSVAVFKPRVEDNQPEGEDP